MRCEGPDGPIDIKATRGVLLGTGGFDHDPVWRSRFLRLPVLNTVSLPSCTGNAQKMGLEVGAALGNMQNYWGTPATIPSADVPESPPATPWACSAKARRRPPSGRAAPLF